MGNSKGKLMNEWDDLEINLKTTHAKRLNELLVTSDDTDFGVLYFKALEYIKPKLQRSEVISDVDKTLNVTIEMVQPKELDGDI